MLGSLRIEIFRQRIKTSSELPTKAFLLREIQKVDIGFSSEIEVFKQD